jgi:hypothetical protein
MTGGRGSDVLWSRDFSATQSEEVNRYLFSGDGQGSDLVVDQGWIGFREGDPEYYYQVLDPYFSSQGVVHWTARYFHPGQWAVEAVDAQGLNLFDTEEAAREYSLYISQDSAAFYLEPLSEAQQVQANDYSALAPLVRAGYIGEDVVQFGPGITPESLTFSWGNTVLEGDGSPHATLDISYANGSKARIVLPNSDDLIGLRNRILPVCRRKESVDGRNDRPRAAHAGIPQCCRDGNR